MSASKLALCAGFCLLATLHAPTASALDPAAARALRNFETAFGSLAKEPRFFDGQKLTTSDVRDASNFLHRFTSNLDRVMSQFKQLPPAVLDDPSFKANDYEGRLNDFQSYQKALEQAVNDAQAIGAGSREVCRKFVVDERTAPTSADLFAALKPLKDPAFQFPDWLQNPEHIKQVFVDAQKMMALCAANPAYKTTTGKECPQNPQARCAFAEKYKEIVQNAVLASIQRRGAVIAAAKGSGSSLERGKGFLFAGNKGPITWESSFTYGPEARKALVERYSKIFDAAEMKLDPNNDALFKDEIARREALRRKVQEMAPTLTSHKGGTTDHYSVALAKRDIKRLHPNAVVKRAYTLEKEWQVTKNALGVPLHRSWGSSYILFKLPDEEWCQLRYFYVAEDYQGGGRYQKAASVDFSETRWQKCE